MRKGIIVLLLSLLQLSLFGQNIEYVSNEAELGFGVILPIKSRISMNDSTIVLRSNSGDYKGAWTWRIGETYIGENEEVKVVRLICVDENINNENIFIYFSKETGEVWLELYETGIIFRRLKKK